MIHGFGPFIALRDMSHGFLDSYRESHIDKLQVGDIVGNDRRAIVGPDGGKVAVAEAQSSHPSRKETPARGDSVQSGIRVFIWSDFGNRIGGRPLGISSASPDELEVEVSEFQFLDEMTWDGSRLQPQRTAATDAKAVEMDAADHSGWFAFLFSPCPPTVAQAQKDRRPGA